MQQFLNVLLSILVLVMSVFLVCLVLIQRGKGGGLAGAFGGVGGSSAFGTKAGDVFTRVTMISAAVWITLSMLLVVNTNRRGSVWPDAPKATGKADPKANPLDLGTAPEIPAVEKGIGASALPTPRDPTAAPVPDVSGGGAAAPLPPDPIPVPKKP